MKKQKNRCVCPTCGHNHIIDDREIAIYEGLIRSLHTVFMWCREKNKHEFKMREVKHLMGHNDYARFGDLVLFGGLVYRPENPLDDHKGRYGLNMDRCAKFFAGKYEIYPRLLKDPITNEVRPIDDFPVTIKGLPKLIDLLDENLEYEANYRPKSLFN